MKKLLLAIMLWCLSASAMAAAFTVKDIRVDGLQRISAGTVFNLLPIKAGDTLGDGQAKTIIQTLYDARYFDDVKLDEIDGVLVITVKERPAISTIEFVGNDDLDSEQLLMSLRQIGFSEGQVFQKSILEQVELELKQQYFNRGKYSVEIDSTITPLSRNRVAIRVSVYEGGVATIAGINIVGNTVYKQDDLLDSFASKTGGLLSRLTSNNQYSKQKLGADLETLRSFYLDHGFADFKVESTQISITPDSKSIFITINISEGQHYRIKEVRLAGNLIAPEAELFKLITIEEESEFSRKEISATTKLLTDRIGDEGYAFANVNAIPEIDRENKEVSLTFFVDPGQRVYVRRINITGNHKTRDEVLRREFRQQESAWMSTSDVALSRSRVKRLGYFSEVDVETLPVAGTNDQVDLAVNVVEQSSGNLSAGLGFSQSQGLLFNANITQNNFLGSGKHLRFGFNNSNVNTVYSLGVTDPFTTIDGISQSLDGYLRKTDTTRANLAVFNTDIWGATWKFGIPISENNRITLGLGYENTLLKVNNNAAQRYQDFINVEGKDFSAYSFSLGWSSDSRDSAILPSEGSYQSLTAEVTIPGSNLEYYKVRYRASAFWPITRSKSLVFKLGTNLGFADSFGSTSEFPFFQNFYAGGIRSVRGYQANTLGFKENGQALGGNLLVTGGAELIFPVPFVNKTLKSFRLSSFIDIGNVYDVRESFDSKLLRGSAGLSVIWLSPFGALSFSWAQPFRAQADDITQSFQFSLGTTF